jgi:hypothetical protein
VSPQCHKCEEVETMEHLLYLCTNYAEKLWAEFGLVLTQTITQFTNEYVARIELTPKEIIYNKPYPAILLRISDKLVRYSILVVIQEIKRNIIFRRMQLTEPLRKEVPRIRMQAHLLSNTQKLISLLEYQGIVQNNAPISFLTALNTSITSNVQ